VNACLRGALFAVFALVLASVPPARAQTELEHKVKAAFLFNFLKFVTWPTDRGPADGHPYVLCVIGDARFTRTLGQAVEDKSVSGHPLEVRDVVAGAALNGCHLAYLAPGPAAPAAESTLGTATGDGVLTVHESDVAVPSGVIRFFLDQQRVRFEINTAAAERRNLNLSSRLLGVAERVQVPVP
jgi:hypothetical protein